MAITITYKILFSIDVLHHYHLDMGRTHYEALSPDDKVRQLGRYNIRQFMELVPTSECRRLMRDLQLIYKNTATGVIIGTPVNEAGDGPAIDIPADAKFTFLLKLVDGVFYNWTNLSMHLESSKKYYFTNAGHGDAPVLNLSQSPATFQEGNPYESGTLVLSDDGLTLFSLDKNTDSAANADLDKDFVALSYANDEDYVKGDIVVRTIGGVDQLFESKIDDPSDTPADDPGNDWKKLRDLPLNYTNANDRIDVRPQLFSYTLPNDTINATVELSAIHPGGNTLVQSDEIEAGNQTLQLDWRSQDPGRYHLRISNSDLPEDDPAKTIHEAEFYLFDKISSGDAFGIIDIHATRADDNRYALLASDGSFQGTENQYFIRFKNRATIWRYIFNTSQALQGSTVLSIEDGNDKILITNDPHPLTANGVIPLQLGDLPLPNASPKMIKPESQNVYSEIFIYT